MTIGCSTDCNLFSPGSEDRSSARMSSERCRPRPAAFRPHYLVAAASSHASSRPVETLISLTQALQSLICRHHGTIPRLVQGFAVPRYELESWDPFPSGIFDVVMQIPSRDTA